MLIVRHIIADILEYRDEVHLGGAKARVEALCKKYPIDKEKVPC